MNRPNEISHLFNFGSKSHTPITFLPPDLSHGLRHRAKCFGPMNSVRSTSLRSCSQTKWTPQYRALRKTKDSTSTTMEPFRVFLRCLLLHDSRLVSDRDLGLSSIQRNTTAARLPWASSGLITEAVKIHAADSCRRGSLPLCRSGSGPRAAMHAKESPHRHRFFLANLQDILHCRRDKLFSIMQAMRNDGFVNFNQNFGG